MNKLCKFDVLINIVEQARRVGRKIVLCHGVFDLLHIGHIRYLRQAAGYGHLLVVTVTPDRFVDKGPNRPAFPEQLRAETLASLAFVDHVAVNPGPTAENVLRALKPDFYVKGAEFRNLEADQTGKIALEAAVAAETGTELVFVEDLVYSSSNLINQHFNTYSEELAQYLELVRQRYDLDAVLAYIDKLKGLRVLVVGDAIIDEYAYCSPLGISTKDPALALRRISTEQFLGGAIAVARHVAGFAANVALYTLFGQDNSQIEAVRRDLPEGLELIYEQAGDRPTVQKLRYVDNYSLAKLLEIYDLSLEPLPAETERAILRKLPELLPKYDLVLAADYGHGLITDDLARYLSREAGFLAVNTQANAGNRGYHTIFRYQRADYVSLARHELYLAFQDRRSEVLDLMVKLRQKLDIATLLVTCGSSGIKALNRDDFIQVPAMAVRAVDRVGAGDALFAVTSLLAFMGCPLELIGLIGNIAGAKMVESIGNNIAVEAGALKKALTAMLK